MQIIQGEITEVIADEGKILINKADPTVKAHHLWLGIYDSPTNWQEVNDDGELEENNLFN